jgi:2-oxoglutarate dehydrogenase E1 component
MQVAHPSTAANYYHLLRTHMQMPFRKPLVVVAPKKLLRYKGATSKLDDFVEGTRFIRCLPDQNVNALPDDQIKKIIFCSGQVYFDLEEARAKNGNNDTAICRVESLCPFPFRSIITKMERYKNASVTWS